MRFLIVATARTGSNLLRGLLHSHPRAFVGGELFNDRLVSEERIPWWEMDDPADFRAATNVDPGLVRLRRDNPVMFLDQLIRTTEDWGFEAVGFKCMYWLPALTDPVLRHLVDDRRVRVIHLKRRNLLRRLVSDQQARISGVWAMGKGAVRERLPMVTLTAEQCENDFRSVRTMESRYADIFRAHDVMDVTYEDLATDPQGIGREALKFLGLRDIPQLQVRFEKTGILPLRDAITNYDQLRSSLSPWASFFDDK